MPTSPTWTVRRAQQPGQRGAAHGTGIVPDSNFTLQEDDVVRIAGTGLGELTNTVEVLDTTQPRRPALQG